MMRVVRTVAELREALDSRRGGSVALVPTMGALHEGHLTLMRAARQAHETVVVSVFVNPTQFTDAADLTHYPRDESGDVQLAASAGADLVFAPDVAEMYPEGYATRVDVSGPLTETLEGAVRGAEHFAGVATVVTKLLIAAAPDAAYFGAKDAQQVLIVRRLVADLGFPTRIEVCPTAREADGLPRSSRNVRLSAADRRRASAVPAALRAVQAAVAAGEADPQRLLGAAIARLTSQGLEPEYLVFVEPAELSPVARIDGPTLCAVAVKVGDVRLLDNVVLEPPGSSGE